MGSNSLYIHSQLESASELPYDRRFFTNQFVLALEAHAQSFFIMELNLYGHGLYEFLPNSIWKLSFYLTGTAPSLLY
jgi:hypothetical protein